MPISNQSGIIFIHIPKTVTEEINQIFNFDDQESRRKWYSYKNEYPIKWKKFITFSVVRNPFDRVISNYRDARKGESYWDYAVNPTKFTHDVKNLKDKSFRELVGLLDELEHEGWENQHTYLTDGTGNLMVDRVIKYENMIEELSSFLSEIGYSYDYNIKNLKNGTYGLDYRSFYDKETRKKVEEKYKKDLEYFNYSF